MLNDLPKYPAFFRGGVKPQPLHEKLALGG
jgi:hypothetical protein